MLNTNITGETKIFKNDKGFYSTSMSKKAIDGTYKNAYIPVQFKKGTELENGAMIIITKGFLSFDKYTPKGTDKEYTSWKIVVTEFTTEGGNTKMNSTVNKPSEDALVDDENLPF